MFNLKEVVSKMKNNNLIIKGIVSTMLIALMNIANAGDTHHINFKNDSGETIHLKTIPGGNCTNYDPVDVYIASGRTFPSAVKDLDALDGHPECIGQNKDTRYKYWPASDPSGEFGKNQDILYQHTATGSAKWETRVRSSYSSSFGGWSAECEVRFDNSDTGKHPCGALDNQSGAYTENDGRYGTQDMDSNDDIVIKPFTQHH